MALLEDPLLTCAFVVALQVVLDMAYVWNIISAVERPVSFEKVIELT